MVEDVTAEPVVEEHRAFVAGVLQGGDHAEHRGVAAGSKPGRRTHPSHPQSA